MNFITQTAFYSSVSFHFKLSEHTIWSWQCHVIKWKLFSFSIRNILHLYCCL